MRMLALLFALTATTVAVTVEIIDLTNNDEVQPYIFEHKVTTFLECIRGILKNGVEESGLPPLDPVEIGDFSLDLNAFQVQGLAGHISGKDLRSSGASEWSMDKLKISVTIFPVGAKVQLDINWPNTTASGSYDIDTNIFGHTIKGKGDYSSVLSNFRIVVDGRASTFPVSIKSAKVKVSLGKSTVSMGSLSFDDVDLAAGILDVGNRLPEIVKNHVKQLNSLITKYAIPIINKIIKKVPAHGAEDIDVNEIPIIGKCMPKKKF